MSIQPRSEDYALGELAEVARALPEHRGQLRTLLEYLALGGVIERDGGMVRLGRLGRDDTQAFTPKQEDAMTAPAQGGGQAVTGINTSFQAAANPGGPAGMLNLSVNIAVDMVAMANWPPQTVSAFMAGLAQVITAKAAAENSIAR